MKIVLGLIVAFFAVMILATVVTYLVAFIMGTLDAFEIVDFMQVIMDKAYDLGVRFGEKIGRIVRGDKE